MAIQIGTAMIADPDGSQAEYENVELLDNGWVKADVPMDSGGSTTTYFSPSAFDRVYKP